MIGFDPACSPKGPSPALTGRRAAPHLAAVVVGGVDGRGARGRRAAQLRRRQRGQRRARRLAVQLAVLAEAVLLAASQGDGHFAPVRYAVSNKTDEMRVGPKENM